VFVPMPAVLIDFFILAKGHWDLSPQALPGG
jgi:hypothetical protein